MFEYLKTALEAIRLAHDGAKVAGSFPQLLPSRPKEFGEITKLASAVFDGDVRNGETVAIEGVLSRYAVFYVPRAFPRLLPREMTFPSGASKKTPSLELAFTLTDEPGQNIHVPEGLKIHQQPEIHRAPAAGEKGGILAAPPYLPAGRLPKLKDSAGDEYQVCFLYPPQSRGIRALPPVGGPGSRYYVAPESQGIPVLLKGEIDVQTGLESVCRVEAIVRHTPEKILDLLAGSPRELRRLAATNFYRGDSPVARGFVLEATLVGMPRTLVGASSTFSATIFVESHFEGMNFENIADLFQGYTLSKFRLLQEEVRNGWSPGLLSFDGVTALGLPGTTLVAKQPNYYGLFSSVDLRNSQEYSSTYKYLRRVAEEFPETVEDLARKFRTENGLTIPELSFSNDFLFDYECQYDFSDAGVLASSEAQRVVAAQPPLAETVDWLRLGRGK